MMNQDSRYYWIAMSSFFGLLLLIPLLLAATPLIASSNLAMGQTTTAATAPSERTFESEEDGYRLQIPQGWVIQDDDIIPDPNIETIAILCPENEALPAIGGEYNCEAAATTDIIIVNRWSDLQSMPEFQSEPSTMITTNDIVALWIQYLQNDTRQIKVENNTDVDEFTKIVDMTYQYLERAGTFLPFDDYTYGVDSMGMYVLSQDRDTGYSIINNIALDNQTQHSPAVQEVFNSFELVEQE